jgi:myo-inositol-1(or 4)-monophosphatase
MLKASRKAARTLIRDYGEICHLQSSLRNLDNFVVTAKQKVENILIDEVKQARADYNIFIEEKIYFEASSAYNFKINAIDGIMNFAHGLPNFTISLGVSKTNASSGVEEILATVVDAPILGETYFAEKNHGAYLEKYGDSGGSNVRLRVSARKEIATSLVAQLGISGELLFPQNTILDNAADLALAYLAAGRYDVVIGYDNKLAANHANLLVQEAGGSIKQHQLIPFVASNNIVKLFKD